MGIQLLDIAHCYVSGRCAIKDVSFTVAPGEQLAIIGPSGAGKTTLLQVIGCGMRPTHGALRIAGADPWSLSATALRALRSKIFLAPQTPPLPPRQRVVHAVLAGRLAQWSTARALLSLVAAHDPAAAHAALERFRLGDKLWLRCDRLSGGERQRVGLARLLLSEAQVLLVDEPVSALDPVLGGQALEVLQEEARTRNAALIASLHDIDLARARFTRLIGLAAGRIVFDLPTAQVSDSRLAELYGPEFATAISRAPTADALPLPPEAPALTRCF